jgi:hypothetical protein
MSASTPNPDTIPLPPSLTSSTSTLPTPTQRALINHLKANDALPGLSDLLSDSLNRNGWVDRVRALSLELLRNGTCDTFPELMEEVMRRAKIPREASAGSTTTTTNGTSGAAATQANGTSTPTGAPGSQGAIVVSKEWSGGPDGLPDVRIPVQTVEVGVEFLKERIKDVVEVPEGQ